MDSELQFQPYAVAYLDILGFKAFVHESESDARSLRKLGRLFNEVIPRQISTEQNNASFPASLNMKCLSVSDSIVITVPIDDTYSSNYPALIAVSIKSIQIAHALLEMGLLVRGAISVGNVFLTDTNIVGTGYQAAEAGEKSAVHPQILLTESATKNLYDYISQGGYRPTMYAENEQGQVILDSISPEHSAYWRNTSGEDSDSTKNAEEAVDRFRIYRNTIEKNLSLGDSRAREKWIWFARLFNANVSYFSQLRNKDLEIEVRSGITINCLNPPQQDSDWLKQFAPP